MVDQDNRLGKAKKLSVPGNRVDSLGSTDLEDLHRFTLDKRSRVTLSLSKIGKGAQVRIELYALTGSLNKRLKKTDFSKLGAKDLQGVLRRVSVSELGDLAAGEYYVRVFGGKGKSRYQLKLSAVPIVDSPIDFPPVVIGITPPVARPITPPIARPITPPVTTPITPPVVAPVEAPKAQISRQPAGPTYTATLDFSQSQDVDPAEDKGRFISAITGRIALNSVDIQYIFQASDLVSFVNSDGQVEYQAKLFNVSSINDPRYEALFVKFILPYSYGADPDSLSFLQNAFNQVALEVNGEFEDIGDGEELKEDVYYGYGSGSRTDTFDTVFLEAPDLEGGDGNDYLVGGNKYYRIFAGDGDDTIYVGNGGSYVEGRNGNDYIVGGDGNDRLHGYEGNDTLFGQAGDDSLNGNEGDDYIVGGLGNDSLFGQEGNDSLFGGFGNDRLHGYEGNDTLNGDEGDDTLNGDEGNDSLFGGDGTDSLNGFLSSDDAGTISGEQFDYLTGGNGSDYFVLGDPNKVFYYGDGDGYAVIEDWDYQLDFIQTKGDASQYRLEFRNVIGSTALDTEIYYANGTIDDRIAIVKDTIDVTFSRDFRFV